MKDADLSWLFSYDFCFYVKMQRPKERLDF